MPCTAVLGLPKNSETGVGGRGTTTLGNQNRGRSQEAIRTNPGSVEQGLAGAAVYVRIASRPPKGRVTVGETIDVDVASGAEGDGRRWTGDGVHVGVPARASGVAGCPRGERVDGGVAAVDWIAGYLRFLGCPVCGGLIPGAGKTAVQGCQRYSDGTRVGWLGQEMAFRALGIGVRSAVSDRRGL